MQEMCLVKKEASMDSIKEKNKMNILDKIDKVIEKKQCTGEQQCSHKIDEGQDLSKVYMENYNKTQKLLKLIQNKLKKHKKDFMNSDKKDWGYAGDMGHYVELLEDVVDFG